MKYKIRSKKQRICVLNFQEAPAAYQSTVISFMETMFGLGLTTGPFIGSILYQLGGFYLPFAVCGTSLVLCSILAAFLFKPVVDQNDDDDDVDRNLAAVQQQQQRKAKFGDLLKVPSISFCCLLQVITGISMTWYLPSLHVVCTHTTVFSNQFRFNFFGIPAVSLV